MPSSDSTPLITLRDVMEDDLAIFYEHQRDPEANAMAAFPARGWTEHKAHWHYILRESSVHTQTILYGEEVTGSVLSYLNEGVREVGYWLGREFWGRGIATRALAEFLKFESTRPLYAHCAQHNIGSRRVLEKCGFMRIGEDSYPEKDGTVIKEFVWRLD